MSSGELLDAEVGEVADPCLMMSVERYGGDVVRFSLDRPSIAAVIAALGTFERLSTHADLYEVGLDAEGKGVG